MVFARVAQYLNGSDPSPSSPLTTIGDGPMSNDGAVTTSRWKEESVQSDMMDDEAARPPYLHAMLAGGLGGLMGDMLMHSLDTVKTRQQGDPSMPPKYTSMGSTFRTMWRQEGVRGLYGGVTPAFLGSFGGTTVFFGTYEWGKRRMIDYGITPSVAYFTAGLFADLAASPLYVPTEVLKTRLQLQGRYNNTAFNSGYNYKSSFHALRTIIRKEGVAELFSGYKATLARDLPFSALQFAFYEQEQKWAKAWVGGREIGLPLEALTGASAGGLAGVITCPLDVVKTRIQTQLDPAQIAALQKSVKAVSQAHSSQTVRADRADPRHAPRHGTPSTSGIGEPARQAAKRYISTGGPSTSLRAHGSVTLDTESVLAGLRIIYRAEGIGGWFRGVGPRGVWTSIQSGTMLVMFQTLLKWFEAHPLAEDDAS